MTSIAIEKVKSAASSCISSGGAKSKSDTINSNPPAQDIRRMTYLAVRLPLLSLKLEMRKKDDSTIARIATRVVVNIDG